MVQVYTRTGLKQQALDRRKKQVMEMPDSAVKDTFLRELETGKIPTARLNGVQLNTITRETKQPGAVAEFIGTDTYAPAFTERRRYEVEAGRDLEPELYPLIYSVTVDESLPKTVDIFSLGPAGVVFEDVKEGGQVKFASVNSRTKSVSMVHKAVGLEYTEDIFLYNQSWQLPILERQFGQAHNAMLNGVHMAPILDFSYQSANTTDGTTLTTFRATAQLPEKYLRTIEAAITASSTDKTNPRRGPYALLVSSADVFTAERALGRVPQEGFDRQSSAIGRVQSVVEYDGWTGTRGKKSTTYAGVPSGTAFLIHLGNRDEDFQSFFKHQLREQMDQGELVRFIMARTVYDVRFGVFADPVRSVQKITWPTAASGAS